MECKTNQGTIEVEALVVKISHIILTRIMLLQHLEILVLFSDFLHQLRT